MATGMSCATVMVPLLLVEDPVDLIGEAMLGPACVGREGEARCLRGGLPRNALVKSN